LRGLGATSEQGPVRQGDAEPDEDGEETHSHAAESRDSAELSAVAGRDPAPSISAPILTTR